MSSGADEAPVVTVRHGAAPTEEEVAAILAAYDALWPRPGAGTDEAALARPPAWRFSGRWWSAHPLRRRRRPGQ